MGQYIQRDTDSATTWNPGGFTPASDVQRNALDTSTAGAISETVNLPALSGIMTMWTFTTPSGEPNRTDWSGGISLQMDVTAAGSSISYNIGISSVAGTGATASTQLSGNQSGIGLKTFSTNFYTTVTSDRRVGCCVQGSNSNMMSAEDLTLRVNTVDSYVEVPWDVGTPPPPAERVPRSTPYPQLLAH